MPAQQLPPEPFQGAGIYAIYYTGAFPLYSQMAAMNRDGQFHWPIYVGKAIPAGARKGGFGLGAEPGLALHRRLADHQKSIQHASNLLLEDFACRFLVVEDIWIPLGEALLIEMFRPLWNRSLDGFGNHDPGKGRHNQRRSPWDTVHPGRPWAEKLQPSDTSKEGIHETATAYIADNHGYVSRTSED